MDPCNFYMWKKNKQKKRICVMSIYIYIYMSRKCNTMNKYQHERRTMYSDEELPEDDCDGGDVNWSNFELESEEDDDQQPPFAISTSDATTTTTTLTTTTTASLHFYDAPSSSPAKACNRNNNSHCEMRKKRVYTPLSGDILSHRRSYIGDSNIPTPTIHNIVSTSKIVCTPPSNMHVDPVDPHDKHVLFLDGSKSSRGVPPSYIDLDHIHEVVHCSHYNRKKFAAITIRIDDPTVTALLFTSGRLVITGSKSWYECMLASLVIVKILREAQSDCYFHVQDCEIQNVVANVIIPGSTPQIPPDCRLNINAMLTTLNSSVNEPVCQYRKFLFPGLVYRPPNSPVVVLCFSSGKCVVTGGRTIEDINIGWVLLWDKIRRFVVDKEGRAILDGGQVLYPMLNQTD